VQTQLLDDPAENVGQMCAAAEDMTGLDQLGVYFSVVTLIPDVELAVQGITLATGLPDAADVIDTNPFTAAVGWQWVNTTATFSWNDGVYRWIIVRDGATGVDLGAANNVTVRGSSGWNNQFPSRLINGAIDTTGGRAWFLAARSSSDTTKIVGLPFNDGVGNISTAATANHIAAHKFVADLSGTATGCRLSCMAPTADGQHRVGIYAADGTAICETETFEEDWGAAWSAGGNGQNTFHFTSGGAIVAGTTYYLGMKSISAVASRLLTFSAENNSHFAVCPGGASNNISSVWNGSTWTDTTTHTARMADVLFGSVYTPPRPVLGCG
jgi:hypothetical protein